MKKNICAMILTATIFLSGCGQGPSLSINTVQTYLEKERMTPISLRYSTSFSIDQRPWLCQCMQDSNEYIIVIYNEKDIKKYQIGIDQKLSRDQMINKLVELGYERNEYMLNNLSVDVTENHEIYWFFPVENSGELLFFTLEGEKIVKQPE